MNPESALEPLAIALHACELAGLAVGEVPDDVMLAAQEGGPFELSFEIASEQQLLLAYDPKAALMQVEVHWAEGFRNTNAVFAALQLNHELPIGRRRFSMEMFTGNIVLSDALDWPDCAADQLALCMCELMLMIDDLAGADGSDGAPTSEGAPGAPAQFGVSASPDSFMNLGVRV